MSKEKKKKIVLPKIDLKKLKLPKFKLPKIKFPKITKKLLIYIGVGVFSVFILVCIILGYGQYRGLKTIKSNMASIGESVQLGYHREFNLIDRLELVDVSNFKSDCEEFSFKCMEMGSGIRKEFLGKLETESFSDDDIEVLNMVSSIDMSVKSDSLDYDQLAIDYNKQSRMFPFVILKLFFKDIVTAL